MELVENGLISIWDILVNRHGIAQESEYKPVFEQLEKTLEKSLLERIKHTEKRCVLLVGNDKDLIRKIACLIYYYSDTLGFYYVDCLNEKTVEDTLSRFKRGTLFLEDLNSKDLSLIKRIDTGITDILNTDSGIRYKFNGAETVTPQGQLIVSVSDINNLPGYFTSRFAMLKPESQITQKAKRAEKLFYNYDNPNKVNLFSKKNESITLTPTESKLFLFLVEDRRTPDEIIEHVWEVYKPKDIAKKKAKGNVKELRNRINNKCCKIGVENLISELTQKYYSLTVEVVERQDSNRF